jgi:hypothetical protein
MDVHHGFITLVCKNGLYNRQIGDLSHLFMTILTIPNIKTINPLAP